MELEKDNEFLVSGFLTTYLLRMLFIGCLDVCVLYIRHVRRTQIGGNAL